LSVQLSAGDRIVIVSDGFTEATDCDGNDLSEENIQAWLRECAADSADQMKAGLMDRLSVFAGGSLADDVTIMVIAAE
jgi:sigma-B regulation protein RsbU (phosphoserine phosphatase)